MDAKLHKTLTSQFGPPSELIDVGKFVKDVADTIEPTVDPVMSTEDYRVDEITEALSNVWNDPELSAYLCRTQDKSLALIHAATKSGRSRIPKLSEPSANQNTVNELQSKLDEIKLSSWKLSSDAAIFTRPPRTSDRNTLVQIRKSDDTDITDISNEPQAVIIFSVHIPLSWRQSLLTRSSTHAILSSQTLEDLFKVIPCDYDALPEEYITEDGNVGYTVDAPKKDSSGYVICIDEVGYGDGGENDYADKLQQHLKTTNSTLQLRKADTPASATPLSSLSLRINQPYWMLHQGNCEHFIVVEHIRMKDASDPATGFPLTLQITPPQLDMCRACTKTPAIYAITGDIRLGESPCLLCGTCWNVMGSPIEDGVTVISCIKRVGFSS
ncbi:hypothetical protein D9758_001909 [Tetrapyrgos nigripes]|uniref:snRNA-activating protein complex subunit 3 n=1 Tax=Tetrapyrgos nigripes TaxID=182062 RepID=A0A8H5GTX5_9AGAR|nr:hypothetical protein D9758_001909 [Tetrapyrgos nigripes]